MKDPDLALPTALNISDKMLNVSERYRLARHGIDKVHASPITKKMRDVLIATVFLLHRDQIPMHSLKRRNRPACRSTGDQFMCFTDTTGITLSSRRSSSNLHACHRYRQILNGLGAAMGKSAVPKIRDAAEARWV